MGDKTQRISLKIGIPVIVLKENAIAIDELAQLIFGRSPYNCTYHTCISSYSGKV